MTVGLMTVGLKAKALMAKGSMANRRAGARQLLMGIYAGFVIMQRLISTHSTNSTDTTTSRKD